MFVLRPSTKESSLQVVFTVSITCPKNSRPNHRGVITMSESDDTKPNIQVPVVTFAEHNANAMFSPNTREEDMQRRSLDKYRVHYLPIFAFVFTISSHKLLNTASFCNHA